MFHVRKRTPAWANVPVCFYSNKLTLIYQNQYQSEKKKQESCIALILRTYYILVIYQVPGM